jgi:aminoglycoside phosphotransferase family enzyme
MFLRLSGRFMKRLDAGRIVDGHGDLRPEHICLIEPPVIFDCLEFNAELRAVDPFEELAFLGLECSVLGADWIGEKIIAQVSEDLDDHPGADLICAYAAFKALLRARLALAHLLEPNPRTPAKWVPQAERYLDAAAQILATA